MSSPMNLIRFSRKISLLVFLATVVRVGTSTAQVLPLSFTKYTVNDYVSSITAGPDGALWFTESLGDKIGRITLDGAVTLYLVRCCSGSIVSGPDGALWLAGSFHHIGRITTSGLNTAYDLLPTPNSDSAGIVAGPDGAFWFTEAGGHKVGRITTDGEVTESPLPSPGVSPYDITAGQDGAMWFTECCDKKIGGSPPIG